MLPPAIMAAAAPWRVRAPEAMVSVLPLSIVNVAVLVLGMKPRELIDKSLVSVVEAVHGTFVPQR